MNDGVSDMVNLRGEQFGQERLESVIADNAGSQSILRAIRDELDAFRDDATQLDDVSIVEIPCIDSLYAGQRNESDGGR